MRTAFILAMAVGVVMPPGGQDRLADQLKKGIVQEEVSQDTAKAIQAYQSIVAQYDADRQAAATALFRLGECYRKTGKREPAIAAYQRVIREFADQAALAESSRRQLAGAFGLKGSPADREGTVSRESYVEVWQKLADTGRALDETKARLNAANARLADAGSSRAQTAEEARFELAQLQRRLAEMQRRVETGAASKSDVQDLKLQYAAEQARYEQLVAERELRQQSEQEARLLAEQTLKSVEAEMTLVQEQIKAIEQRVSLGVVSANDAELLQLRRDLLGLERKAQELKAGFKR